MRRTPKPASLLAPLLLVLALVTGCGSSDASAADGADQGQGDSAAGPPTDASVEDFCATFTELIQRASEAGSGMSDSDAIKLAKQTADKLSEIGTPKDIPAEAREAFELAMEKIQSVPDDATREELNAFGDDLTDEQKAKLDALTTYVATTCMSLPTDLPSS